MNASILGIRAQTKLIQKRWSAVPCKKLEHNNPRLPNVDKTGQMISIDHRLPELHSQ